MKTEGPPVEQRTFLLAAAPLGGLPLEAPFLAFQWQLVTAIKGWQHGATGTTDPRPRPWRTSA